MAISGLAAIGAGIAVGLAGLGTGYAQGNIGSSALGALGEKPELLGASIILVAIPEVTVVLGFVIAALVLFT